MLVILLIVGQEIMLYILENKVLLKMNARVVF